MAGAEGSNSWRCYLGLARMCCTSKYWLGSAECSRFAAGSTTAFVFSSTEGVRIASYHHSKAGWRSSFCFGFAKLLL